MTTHRGVNPDWMRRKKSFKPKMSGRQRSAKGVFDKAVELGWKPGPFPTPQDAQEFIDAYNKKHGIRECTKSTMIKLKDLLPKIK